MNTSILNFVVLLLALFTESTFGDDDDGSSLKINAGRFFDDVTDGMNNILKKHENYVVDQSQYTTQTDDGSANVTLSGGTVQTMGEVSHSDVTNDLYTDPAVHSLHPAFTTIYSLKPSQLVFNYSVGNSGLNTDQGEVAFTMSGVEISVGVALIKDAAGTYARFIQSNATNGGELSSTSVSGSDNTAETSQAIAATYNQYSQSFLYMIVKSFDIVFAQLIATTEFKL